MELVTRRLRLVPMSLTQMELAQTDIEAAMRPFVYNPPPRAELAFLRKVMRAKALLMREEPYAWLLCTYFRIVDKDTGVVMGEAGFKGPPTDGGGSWIAQGTPFALLFPDKAEVTGGSVEIGYGLQPAYHNQGYMTEAVQALCRFAFAQREAPVSSIIASTERDNHASRRVLEKCGFVWQRRHSHLFWWRLTPSNLPPEGQRTSQGDNA